MRVGHQTYSWEMQGDRWLGSPEGHSGSGGRGRLPGRRVQQRNDRRFLGATGGVCAGIGQAQTCAGGVCLPRAGFHGAGHV